MILIECIVLKSHCEISQHTLKAKKNILHEVKYKKNTLML